MRAPDSAHPADRHYLRAAAVLVGVESLVLVVLGIVELVHLDRGEAGVALTTTAFFWLVGAGLAYAALALARCARWARSPILLAQLLALGVTLDAVGTSVTVALASALPAIAVMVLVLHPASTAALGGTGDHDD